MYRQLVFLALALAAGGVPADPLFESDERLPIVLKAPFSTMERERDKDQEYAGEMRIGDQVFAVDFSMRGNRRLSKQTCDHPPLRLDFRKSDVKDTLFAKQDDIKLVVQCDDASRYQDYLRTEFLVYRALNLLTPNSYQVRWADVTFQDSDGKADRLQPAFFVERKSRLAKRLGLDTTDVISISLSQLEPVQAALVSLFQYVVANPDFSLVQSPPGEECCHNAKLLLAADGRYLPVIYDFDSTGLVGAHYAVPPDGLPIRSVKDRLYRGYCEHNPMLAAARAQLLAQAEALSALIENDPLLSKRASASASRFLSRSLDMIRDDKSFERQVLSRCR